MISGHISNRHMHLQVVPRPLLTWQDSKSLIKHQTHRSDYSAQQSQAKNHQLTCGDNMTSNLFAVAREQVVRGGGGISYNDTTQNKYSNEHASISYSSYSSYEGNFNLKEGTGSSHGRFL
jgi:hypothetical protein